MSDDDRHDRAIGGPLQEAIRSIDGVLANNRATIEAFEGAELIARALRRERDEPLGRIQQRGELARILRRIAIWLTHDAI